MALRADGSSGAVTGEDPGFVGQGEQAGGDGVDDLRVVAAGEVGAAYAAGKEGVAGDEQVEWGEVEADGALGVAGGVEDLGGIAVEADDEAVGERFVGGRGFRRGNAQPAGLRLHHFEQGKVVFVEEDGGAGETLKAERTTHVVDVGVGDEDLLELEAEFGQSAVNASDFVAGIDDDGFTHFFVTEQGAVALQRADGKGLQDHSSILCLSPFGLSVARHIETRAEGLGGLVEAPGEAFKSGAYQRKGSLDAGMNKFEELTTRRKQAHAELMALKSKVYEGFLAMEKAAFSAGVLSKKEKELIAVGISVVKDCESCMQWHIEQAAASGASFEEIFEAIEVGIEMGGGPATVSARFALEVMEDLGLSAKRE